MKTIASVITFAAILAGGTLAADAQSHQKMTQAPQEAQWGPAPPMLPPGAQIAVLSGNPGASGPYSVRLKFPANYLIPAHSHPTDENVVVVSGSVTFGMGDKLVKGAPGNQTIGAGGYAIATANVNHFAYTTQEATIVLYGLGPVEFTYVNPSDDPRTAKKSNQ
jgi:quercetin dioxygenase-like cupin family protein